VEAQLGALEIPAEETDGSVEAAASVQATEEVVETPTNLPEPTDSQTDESR
jgi:hypothetical protein